MRVPTITTYNAATYMLGNLTNDLKDANEVVSTQKRIIEISDDPVGLNQVLTLKNTLGNLTQIEQNVAMGKSWLNSVESSLDSVNDLILEVKTEVARLSNDSTTASERANAVERINSVITQIVTLGNTQVNGNYIFGGTDSKILPFVHDENGKPEQVVYKGNDIPFEIRTDKKTGVPVGRDGEKTFWDEDVQINASNNTLMFKEDLGRGSAFEKLLKTTVPDGLYTVETLSQAIRNGLNAASEASGYKVKYQVDYDPEQKKYTIQSDGSYSGFIETTFLWENGGEAYLDKMTAGNGIDLDDLNIQVKNSDALTLGTTVNGQAAAKPMRFVWDGDEHWTVINNPGYIMPSKVQGTARGFELDLTESGSPQILVTLDNPALMQGAYVEFDIIPATGDYSIGHEIGFSGKNTISTPPVSDTWAQYITDLTIVSGVNDTIDFMEARPPSIIPAGMVFNADYTAALPTAVSSGTMAAGSTLASGSVIGSGTTLGSGTIIGSGTILVSDVILGRDTIGVSSGTLISGSTLGAGTILGSGTILAVGTTVGSGTILGSGTVLTTQVTLGQTISGISAGTLMTGSVLTSGTILGNGVTLAANTVIGSGTVLTTDIQLNANITLANSGTLTAGTFIASGSTLTPDTILASGEQISLTNAFNSGAVTVSGDGVLTLVDLAGGVLGGGSYTVISGDDTLNQGIIFLGAGSTLAYATASGIMASGSFLNGTQMTLSSGSVLHGDMTLRGADMVLKANTTLMAGTTLATGSVLEAGSSVNDQAITLSDTLVTLTGIMNLAGTTTLNGTAANNLLGGNMTVVAGSTLAAGSTLINGSSLADGAITTGASILLGADMTVLGVTGLVLGLNTVVQPDTLIQPGTLIAQNSILKTGTVLDEDFPMDATQTIAAGMAFSADFGLATPAAVINSGTLAVGSHVSSGSFLVAGSVLGSGTIIGSGIVLTADVQVATDITINNSGFLNPGSFVASGSILAAASILASGEQISLTNASGIVVAVVSGDGVQTLANLASGIIGGGPYSVISGGDTLSNGIITLASGSILSFSTASGLISSGSFLAGSQITLSSGSTLNAVMNVVGDGVILGADMTLTAGTILARNTIVAAGSFLDVPVVIGGTSGELTAVITAGNYTDMDALCLEIQTQLEEQSANNIAYSVSYDSKNSLFNIRENGSTLDELTLLWKSGTHSASSIRPTLGYYVEDDVLTYPGTDNGPVQCSITIDDTNDILDFEEIDLTGLSSGTLKAFISHGTYTDMTSLLNRIETAMETVSANGVNYTVSYDNALIPPRLAIQSQAGALNELRLFNDSDVDSINDTLGFDLDQIGGTGYGSASPPVLMTFDNNNNRIDFQEKNIDGFISDPISIEIPQGSYTDLDDVALAIQNELREASPNSIAYNVTYDFGSGKFTIKGSHEDLSSFSLLWKTGLNSEKNAAGILGIDRTEDDVMVFSESDKAVVNINIDAFNNKIDFQEIALGSDGKGVDTLTAAIETKTYTSYQELSQEIEEALEKESHNTGNSIDYSVSWDEHTQKFSIKEDGTRLEEFRLLWQSGDNTPIDQGGTGWGIGSILGFDGLSDDVIKPLSSTNPVRWGIFNTLVDLKQYLLDNDRNGIERTLGRLETNYNQMTSRIVDTGMKYNRLEVRQTITTQMKLTFTERRSTLEDADIVESIMNLQNLQVAYEAALKSTAKVMNISLMDYL